MPKTADTSDLNRRIDSLIRVGTIAEVDHNSLRCRVNSGLLTTDWLPVFAQRAGNIRTWSPPSTGEQCIVISPGGDMAAGLVLVGLNSTAHPAPDTSPDIESATYPDGAVVSYDHARHALSITLPDGGTASITAPASVTITTPELTLSGNLTVGGYVHATDDVVAGEISLQSHVHGNVLPGPAKTGVPE